MHFLRKRCSRQRNGAGRDILFFYFINRRGFCAWGGGRGYVDTWVCWGFVYGFRARIHTRVHKGPEHHTPPMSVPPPKLTMKVYCYLHALQSFIELLRRAPRNQRLGTPRRRPQRPSSCGRERTGSPSSSFRPWRLQGPCSRSRGRGRR